MYDRQVKGQELTLTVSGKLWNRSLVMEDRETKSLWSHILGEAMGGKLKGTVLTSLPSEMVTWSKWKAAHPKTTVLNLKRSSRNYTKEFYEDPDRFVIGFHGDFRLHHCSFATLIAKPVLNIKTDGVQLVLTYDAEGTSGLLFVREVDDRVLSFASAGEDKLRDEQTKTLWDRATGLAIEGELAGKRLKPYVGVPSFKRAWLTFHPDSNEIK